MQYTPLQLKERLLESIDSQNNVVDMPKLLEVIAILEKFVITKEILEETRIGRLVNDVRRKTTDKRLSKRAKELVRSWQKVVNSASEGNTIIVNGEGLNSSKLHGNLPVVIKKHISPTTAGHVGKSASTGNINRCVSPNDISSKNSVTSSLSLIQLANRTNVAMCNNRIVSPKRALKRSLLSPHLHDPSSAKRLCISPSVVAGSRVGSPDSVGSQNSRGASTIVSHDTHPTASVHTSYINASDSSNIKRTHSIDSFSTTNNHLSDLRAVQSTSNIIASNGEHSSGHNGMDASRMLYNHVDISTTSTHSIETQGLKTTIRFTKTSPSIPPVNGMEVMPVKRGRGRPPKLKPKISGDHHVQTFPNGSATVAKSLSKKRKVKLGINTDIDIPSSSKHDGFLSLTPKVKSTAELIQKLQQKNHLSVGTDTAKQLKDNLFQKEEDDNYHSVVPDGAKPRYHRKRGARNEFRPPSTPVSLQTKAEMVEKFLQSSFNQASHYDISPLKYELPQTESLNTSTSFENGVVEKKVCDANCNISNRNEIFSVDQTDSKAVILKAEVTDGVNPSSDKSTVDVPGSSLGRSLTLQEIYSQYPPLALDNFVFDDGEYEISELPQVTDSIVNRLHQEHWSGVNGYHNCFGDWRDFTQTLSLESYNSDRLQILPYVIIE